MISADDYGMSSEINKAIENLSKNKRLDGFSIMINGEFDRRTVNDIRLNHGTQIGLHIDLNYFVNLGLKNIIVLGISIKTSKDINLKIKDEVARQFTLFRKILGFWPDYVDGHQHCQMFKPVVEKIIEFKKKEIVEFWVRDSAIVEPNIKSLIISTISYKNWTILMGQNNIRIKKICGIYNFRNQIQFSRKLDTYRNGLNKDTNFMTHPSVGIKEGKFRLWEYNILSEE